MPSQRYLFVIDSQPETGDVLKAILEKQNTQVKSFANWQQVLMQTDAVTPGVVVMRVDQVPPELPQIQHL